MNSDDQEVDQKPSSESAEQNGAQACIRCGSWLEQDNSLEVCQTCCPLSLAKALTLKRHELDLEEFYRLTESLAASRSTYRRILSDFNQGSLLSSIFLTLFFIAIAIISGGQLPHLVKNQDILVRLLITIVWTSFFLSIAPAYYAMKIIAMRIKVEFIDSSQDQRRPSLYDYFSLAKRSVLMGLACSGIAQLSLIPMLFLSQFFNLTSDAEVFVTLVFLLLLTVICFVALLTMTVRDVVNEESKATLLQTFREASSFTNWLLSNFFSLIKVRIARKSSFMADLIKDPIQAKIATAVSRLGLEFFVIIAAICAQENLTQPSTPAQEP